MHAEHQGGESRSELFAVVPPPSSDEIAAAALRLRSAVGRELPLKRIAASLAAVSGKTRSSAVIIQAIADRLQWSAASLSFSLAAMLDPFLKAADLESFARRLRSPRKLVGLVMAGNIPGAGLHEVIAALLTGHAAMVKTATGEPIFFAAFAALLRKTDPELGERIAVFNWPREREDLTTAMRASCDVFAAFGDDGTIERLRSSLDSNGAAPFTGFGARVSGAVLSGGALDESTLYAAAEDVIRFEQRGCLSPHHIFIETPGGSDALQAAARLAGHLQRISTRLAPSLRLSLEDAAAIRRAREIARWRTIGGHDVKLWEGARLAWTVIYDREANFTGSPGYRTVFVSPFSDSSDLERRLAPARQRTEAFALVSESNREELEPLLRACGATYICEPGRMQSPPLNWPHGGGAFLRILRDDK